jgi:hypothetical protein
LKQGEVNTLFSLKSVLAERLFDDYNIALNWIKIIPEEINCPDSTLFYKLNKMNRLTDFFKLNKIILI